jgi:hypothetical protein
MSASAAVVVAALAPLAGLVLWLDRAYSRFVPPRCDDYAASVPGDTLVRRLAVDLDRASADAALRNGIYRSVIQDLVPSIQRRLATSGDLPAAARVRLQAVLEEDHGESNVKTPTQLEELLTDLEYR